MCVFGGKHQTTSPIYTVPIRPISSQDSMAPPVVCLRAFLAPLPKTTLYCGPFWLLSSNLLAIFLCRAVNSRWGCSRQDYCRIQLWGKSHHLSLAISTAAYSSHCFPVQEKLQVEPLSNTLHISAFICLAGQTGDYFVVGQKKNVFFPRVNCAILRVGER